MANDPDDRSQLVDRLVENGAFAGGDWAAISSLGEPPGMMVRAALRAALDGLESQGFIRFVPAVDWPSYVTDGSLKGAP